MDSVMVLVKVRLKCGMNPHNLLLFVQSETDSKKRKQSNISSAERASYEEHLGPGAVY